ncbi:MAG TPA: putative lipopolysaccharide heptosyltransferase III, partial [Chlamydiales bacterium]|nr:putative lipopolysaccharide heptosyltransferase III [Chlamydiales bacterium]
MLYNDEHCKLWEIIIRERIYEKSQKIGAILMLQIPKTLYGGYPDLRFVKKILVIKLRQLGDVLLTGPVFSALKTQMPDAEIDAYVYSEAIPILEGHSAVSRCIAYDRNWKKEGFFKKLGHEWKVLRGIRAERYDLVINLTEGDRGAIAAKISGAKICVGFDPKGSGLFGKKKLYTHVVKNCPSLRHTVERNLDAVRRIGIFPPQEERDLSLHIPETALAKMRDLAGSDFILIHPTSRWKFKCWPAQKMRQFAQILAARGHSLVFTSGSDPEELAMIAQIAESIPCLDLSGKVSLKELGALIQLSSGVVCVDSL